MSLIVYGAEDITSYTALVSALQFSCSTAYLFFFLNGLQMELYQRNLWIVWIWLKGVKMIW
jgi:hypothetical protein